MNKKIFFWVTLFAIAMGFLESAVVVYLRQLYYPAGFQFPLAPIEPLIAHTEFWREAATIVMLAAVGFFCGTNKASRLAWFMYAFAIWDLFYYIFLKLILNWPDSLYTWDILFLIPVPWVGPVIAPCIVSLSMIALALLIVFYNEKRQGIRLNKTDLFFFISGSCICILSFCYDYLQQANSQHWWTIQSETELFEEIKTYVPQQFNWALFWTGESLIIIGIIVFWTRSHLSVFNK